MFNPISDTFRFIKKNMMLEKNPSWNPDGDNGMGDALWRTSVSYIAYKDNILRDAIISCFRKFTMINRKNKYWYQGSRAFDRHCEDDVSRDQTILALTSLKINGDDEVLNEIANHLPYKLSRRFSMGPTLWIWIKAITGKGKFYTYLFGLLELIEFLPSVLWDKFLRKIMGWDKEYSQKWYMDVDYSIGFWTEIDGKEEWIVNDDWYWVNNGQRLHSRHQHKKKHNKLYKILDAMEYPEYALHLTAWMVYVSDDTFFKKILQKLGIWLAEKDNLLVRKLLGDEVTQEEIDNFYPMECYRWSCRFNGTSYSNYVKGDDAIYNTIDKDVLLGL